MNSDSLTNVERFDRAVAQFRDGADKIDPRLLDWGVVEALAEIEPTMAHARGSHRRYFAGPHAERGRNVDPGPNLSPLEMLLVALVGLAGEKAAAVDRADAIEQADAERRDAARRLLKSIARKRRH